MDESLRGYMTKYDCSSADINPIGKHLNINENENEQENKLNMRIKVVLYVIVLTLFMSIFIVNVGNYLNAHFLVGSTCKYVMSSSSVVD